jgi:hypothetical protein
MTSFIEAAALEALRVMKGKNEDYAPTTEFSNFEKAAEFAGVTVDEAISVMIGIKQTRAEALADGRQVNNEALDDTLLDWQNYINILRAWRTKQMYDAMDASVAQGTADGYM